MPRGLTIDTHLLPTDDGPLVDPFAEVYAPSDGVFDELLTPRGALRPGWKPFLDSVYRLGGRGMRSCVERARRLIREHGVTYNVYGDPEGRDRPWPFDPVPLIIGHAEWAELEAGLKQRARLLNALLGDLYGAQRVLSEGLLPAALVFGHPAFLHSLRHAPVPASGHLQVYAADLGRGPDGRWWVIADRTQAPSGAGYALENRIISRSMPELSAGSDIVRLAGFFQTMRDHLIALTGKDQPRLALLTPGPFNETYFEHAYLARYLGFSLVEGDDLTVRDDRLFMKSLEGLQPIDLLLRRQDSNFCDPLELRHDSTLGVPGLLSAVRAGHVIIANPLGSGVVECEGLQAFLPGLCQALLGETLQIPCVATWWCGHADARAHVEQHLDELIIQRAFQPRRMLSRGDQPLNGALLSGEERARLFARMAVRGFDYVGQEPVKLSTMPAWVNGRLVPRPMSLRVYLCADGDDWRVLPGGLTRIAGHGDARAISMQRGDGSKDTWVLAAPQQAKRDETSLLPLENAVIPLRRGATDLASRSADNLFWLGRYTERTEGGLRLLRCVLMRLSEESLSSAFPVVLRHLLDLLVSEDDPQHDAAQLAAKGHIGALDLVLARMVFERDNPRSLANNVDMILSVASLVRDRLSVDAWRTLSHLRDCLDSRARKPRLRQGDALDLSQTMLRTLLAFSGMESENMTRNAGWRFLDMGRRVERAINLAHWLDLLMADGDPERDGGLEILLELADSFMTYRSRYVTTPRLAPVLDLLLRDDSNPRAIDYQLRQLESHVAALPRLDGRVGLSPAEKIVLRMSGAVRLAELGDLCRRDDSGRRQGLRTLLGTLTEAMPQLSDELARVYFAHVTPVATGARAVRA